MDVVSCDKPNGMSLTMMIFGSPKRKLEISRKRSELKHLSSYRKGNQPRFRKYWRKKSEQAKVLFILFFVLKDLEKSVREGNNPVLTKNIE